MRIAPPGSDRALEPAPGAGSLFTDREPEAEAFGTSLSAFRQLLDSDTDAGVSRRNVLVFHGLGGIGKTTLSERLQMWISTGLAEGDRWGPAPATRVATTARIDFHGSAGQVDVLAALVTLRASVSRIKRRWPTFDLAFAAHWAAVRPREPLPRFGGRDELGDAVADTVTSALGDLASIASVAAPGTGAGLGVRAVRHLITQLRRRRDLRLALQAYDGFEDFLLRCADPPSGAQSQSALACEIAGALSWELAQIQPTPLVAVFIDTAERLTLDARRVAESHINSIVHRMPNVLFVVSGRKRLDWDDESRSDLPWRGPWTWPGLVDGVCEEPRQHRIGSWSRQDSRRFIVAARGQWQLPMSDEVVEELITAAAGLPQYLELARQVALSIKSAGTDRQVTVADVTGSLGSLVNRVLDDIPADEQRVIRAAALFRAFNLDLVAAAADVDRGCAQRAVERPMIEPHDDPRFPLRMHDAIRTALRSSDHQVTGGWTERDWELASTRAAAEAHRQHDAAKFAGTGREVLDALGVAIGLVCDQHTELEPSMSSTYEDWLSQAIVYAPSIQGLITRIPTASKTRYGQGVLDFIAGKSGEAPHTERLRLLRSIFDSTHPLRIPAGRHLGYALKREHRWTEALSVFDQLVALAPTDVNLRQRPQVLALARQFTDARAAAKGTSVEDLIRRVTEYAHGRPDRYFREVGEKFARLHKQGRQREYLEEMGDFLARSVFFRPETVELQEIEGFLDEADGVGHVVATRSALQALALHGGLDRSAQATALDRLHALDQEHSPHGEISFRYALAELCDALVVGELDRLGGLHAEISRVGVRTRSWIPVECLLGALDLPLTATPTQWTEPYDVVVGRWRAHLAAYLVHHGVAVPARLR